MPTEEPTPEPTVEPTATPEPTVVPAEEPTVGPAAALPGSFTTQYIGIANLETGSQTDTATLTLYNLDTHATSNPSVPAVYRGGASVVTDSDFSDGRYSGVIASSVQMAAAALMVNQAALTADAYTGVDSPATPLYGTLIFNMHSDWESTLYCQNAGSGTATINAALYKTGEAIPRITLSASVLENETVTWDIADDVNVQAAWPGGTGEFGYVVFNSANNIACVVDNQRVTLSPYVQSQFNGVPSSYASTDLRVPLVFNGHGTSSSNARSLKWNTGISLINPDASDATVSVTYTSGSYSNTCTKTIPGNGSDVWYAPEIGTGAGSGVGWSCPSGPLSWSYPGGPTYGSATITSNVAILAIGNSNRYDSAAAVGAGYSSLAAAPIIATSRAVCPLSFNKDPGTDWITGIQAANVGTVATDITFKMVRFNGDPAIAGNSVTITKSGVAAGSSDTAYFPEEGSALTNFEGAVFVEATASGALIAASSSNTNYNTLSAAAMYDCINY